MINWGKYHAVGFDYSICCDEMRHHIVGTWKLSQLFLNAVSGKQYRKGDQFINS